MPKYRENPVETAQIGEYTIRIIYDDWYDFIEVKSGDEKLLHERIPYSKKQSEEYRIFRERLEAEGPDYFQGGGQQTGNGPELKKQPKIKSPRNKDK